MADVFISYVRDDRAIAEKIARGVDLLLGLLRYATVARQVGDEERAARYELCNRCPPFELRTTTLSLNSRLCDVVRNDRQLTCR